MFPSHDLFFLCPANIGSWKEFSEFDAALEKRGVAAMELFCSDLKRRGQYQARTLSFAECNYRIQVAPLTDDFKELHNKCSKIWTSLRELMGEAIKATNVDGNKIWPAFWGSFQRFFRALCIATKTETIVKEVKTLLLAGKCAVIGLQSTSEAALNRFQGKGMVSDTLMTLSE